MAGRRKYTGCQQIEVELKHFSTNYKPSHVVVELTFTKYLGLPGIYWGYEDEVLRDADDKPIKLSDDSSLNDMRRAVVSNISRLIKLIESRKSLRHRFFREDMEERNSREKKAADAALQLSKIPHPPFEGRLFAVKLVSIEPDETGRYKVGFSALSAIHGWSQEGLDLAVKQRGVYGKAKALEVNIDAWNEICGHEWDGYSERASLDAE